MFRAHTPTPAKALRGPSAGARAPRLLQVHSSIGMGCEHDAVSTCCRDLTLLEILATFLVSVDTWAVCAASTRAQHVQTSCVGSAPHTRSRGDRNAIFSDAAMASCMAIKQSRPERKDANRNVSTRQNVSRPHRSIVPTAAAARLQTACRRGTSSRDRWDDRESRCSRAAGGSRSGRRMCDGRDPRRRAAA